VTDPSLPAKDRHRQPARKLPVCLKTHTFRAKRDRSHPTMPLTGCCVGFRDSASVPGTVFGASRAAFGPSNRAYVGHGAKRMWSPRGQKPRGDTTPRLMLQPNRSNVL
jgi:hypothetical protein